MADITPGWQELPELDFQIALDTLEAMEELENRAETPTPETVRQVLDPTSADPTVTLPLIKQGMAQVGRWREQAGAREILRQRRELQICKWQLYFTGLALRRLQNNLEILLGNLDRILQSIPRE